MILAVVLCDFCLIFLCSVPMFLQYDKNRNIKKVSKKLFCTAKACVLYGGQGGLLLFGGGLFLYGRGSWRPVIPSFYWEE